MPNVFISYSREDREVAEIVASSLEAEGFSVWWDAVLRSGEAYDEVTEENLRSADTVVVLWSRTSTKSKWVRAEATLGERHSTLVPALIEDCDRPLRFELIQTADLSHWRGDRSDAQWRGFTSDIRIAIDQNGSSPSLAAPAAGTALTDEDAAHSDDTIEEIYWSTIKDTDESAELEAYLKRYRNGKFITEARQRLAALKGRQGRENTAPRAEEHTAGATGEVPQALIAVGVFAAATMAGMTMLVVANAIHIGSFDWAPSQGAEVLHAGTKEVGFVSALNWSVSALVLMPVAWTMIYLAICETRTVWAAMVSRRMIVTTDFAPMTVDHPGYRRLQKHLAVFIRSGIVAVTVLTIALALSDHSRIAGQFYADAAEAAKLDRLDESGYALSNPNIERDWGVAAFLSTPSPDKPDADMNGAFSLAAYVLYVGFGIGALLSFGLVSLGLGATFLPGVMQGYGLRLAPDLNSDDKRGGFETVRPFFTYAFAVAFIGCVMCYLMGLQNIYLRSPDQNIFAFLAPDLAGFGAAGNWRQQIDALVGFLFYESVAKGTRNVYVWIFGFFIFAVFVGGFTALLRQGVLGAKSALLQEMQRSGLERIEHLTGDGRPAIEKRLSGIRVWPLTRPSLRASIVMVALLVGSFVFYKLGALIVLALSIIVPAALWRSAD